MGSRRGNDRPPTHQGPGRTVPLARRVVALSGALITIRPWPLTLALRHPDIGPHNCSFATKTSIWCRHVHSQVTTARSKSGTEGECTPELQAKSRSCLAMNSGPASKARRETMARRVCNSERTRPARRTSSRAGRVYFCDGSRPGYRHSRMANAGPASHSGSHL